MKILNNFDTKREECFFVQYAQQYWADYVYIIKRHVTYLLKSFFPFVCLVLAVIALFLLARYSGHLTYTKTLITLIVFLIWFISRLSIIVFSIVRIHKNAKLNVLDYAWHYDTALRWSFFLWIILSVLMIWYIICIFRMPMLFVQKRWILLESWVVVIISYLIYTITQLLISCQMDFMIVTPDTIDIIKQGLMDKKVWLFSRVQEVLYEFNLSGKA